MSGERERIPPPPVFPDDERVSGGVLGELDRLEAERRARPQRFVLFLLMTAAGFAVGAWAVALDSPVSAFVAGLGAGQMALRAWDWRP